MRTRTAAVVAIAVALASVVAAPARPADAVAPSELKPEIVRKPIPYGRKRISQMAAYSKRHYGVREWRLEAPAVIVQHYTAGTSFLSAWNHFASNARWNGEKPGTCAHFMIDRDGTIYQLVRLGKRCRHVVGLNHAAFGIEHVGTSSRMVLGNEAQMRSSLALTVWLMRKTGVPVGDVIGHAEALHHRLHFERYANWRCLVHADFGRRAMREYRSRLRDAAAAAGVPGGPGPVWRPSGC